MPTLTIIHPTNRLILSYQASDVRVHGPLYQLNLVLFILLFSFSRCIQHHDMLLYQYFPLRMSTFHEQIFDHISQKNMETRKIVNKISSIEQ